MEIYSSCTSKDFKTDISQLCEHCPLTGLINEGIKNQIIFQASEKKDILTNEQFKEYIDSEVKNAQDALQKTSLIELQNKNYRNDPYRKNRSKNYIWNKERIKALNKFANPDEQGDAKNHPHSHIFTNKGYKLFTYIFENYITKNRGRYADLSYFYWRLHEDKHIIQRPEAFSIWFKETYQEEFTKLKTLYQVKSATRDKQYSMSLKEFGLS